jgi:hypothetical protein
METDFILDGRLVHNFRRSRSVSVNDITLIIPVFLVKLQELSSKGFQDYKDQCPFYKILHTEVHSEYSISVTDKKNINEL